MENCKTFFASTCDKNVMIMTIDKSTNRVGIGTTEPIETLDVNGNVNINGILNSNFNKLRYFILGNKQQQRIPSRLISIINYNNFDKNDFNEPMNNNFMIPQDGIYEITSSILWENDNDKTSRIHQIYINNGVYAEDEKICNIRGSSNLSIVIKLNKNDLITFRVYHEANKDLNLSNAKMSIRLLGI